MGSVHDLDEFRRAELGRAVMEVLDDWGVGLDQGVVLLALPAGTRPRSLNRYRTGAPLPEDAETLERGRCLLAIHRAAHTMYPHSPVAANFWVTTSNPYFDDRSPLDVMLASGMPGIRWVMEHLDGTSPWG